MAGRRQSVAGAALALGDGPPDRRRDLLVQGAGVGRVQTQQHGANKTSTNSFIVGWVGSRTGPPLVAMGPWVRGACQPSLEKL
ncbi:hypothetical protein GCM10010339_33930 [Streptomyces alanosinicus]|uniref:Uncharacterized protein n=1 Tax=Streptomyces alanosinicus TaxID=68171 RepID=A0A918YI93_9ACTN|nr:hypothetical protein GCM10010339_33930 [Streptomyces alanosinicus]